ncbi:hypothetical protein D9758_000139 [Tetrapyrgos nigripes]|uniref:Uncharacterized protein n=1 Tax=Tetrapyrgos nigripes TaxID=182062 RepID=A0A8H5H1U3_9AGAR|nr:hypothetical protein D9758_000139 [Tetrapyrgos nigripes]
MAPSKGSVLAHHFVYLVLSFVFVLAFVLESVSAGQFFTSGISIIDAPSVGNPGHAGSNIPIAIEISGNGQLPASEATNPDSSSSIHYTSLEIYLVSASTNSNFTVSSGPGLLSQEPGSTVKHLDWQIPSCIPPGDYNLTFYEGAMINGESHFIITPVSIPVDNPNSDSSSNCDPSTVPTNPLQAQPQPDFPPPQALFGDGKSSLSMVTRTTSPLFSLPTLLTITLSASGGIPIPLPILPTVTVGVTDTVTATAQTQTVVVVSMTTFTTSVSGSVETVTETALITTAVPVQDNNSGFIPVNSAAGMDQNVFARILLPTVLLPIMMGLWIFI